jgi:hypothetical protein
VWESIGDPEDFELPYWRGGHPSSNEYPLPFHPLEMGDSAMRSVLGLRAEGEPNAKLTAPEDVPLQSWWPQTP